MHFLLHSSYRRKAVGELFFGDGVRYPFTHALEALLGQVKASQLFINKPRQCGCALLQ
jgi:hypothetical protein